MSKKKTSQHKEPSWLVAQRKKAEKKFATLSMPTIKDDAWRYTNPALFTLIKKQSSRHLVLPVISQEQIDQGVIVEDLLTAAKKHLACVKQAYAAIQKTTDKHSTLNDAAWNQGIFIFVPDGVLVSVPITVRHGETTGASLCKTVLMLGKKSRLTYVEEYAGTGNYNDMTILLLGDQSHLDFYTMHANGKNAVVVSNNYAILNKEAALNWTFGCFGQGTERLKLETIFAQQGSTATITGLFQGRKNQQLDITTNAIHQASDTKNKIQVKGIMQDDSRSVYRGMIQIEKKAYKTNSFLKDQTLMIGKKSFAYAIPALDIKTNDVQAGHAASVGRIDDAQLFYLQSRGLTQQQAESMIIHGFFEPLLQVIPLEHFRNTCQKLVG